jgi:predicted RNA-binding protein with PUA-like domain
MGLSLFSVAGLVNFADYGNRVANERSRNCIDCQYGKGGNFGTEAVNSMATQEATRYWLFKEEPTHYNYADLERDGRAVWDGVTNALALRHLRQVRVGDRVLYYHTGKEKAIVGEMQVVSVTADPLTVEVAPLRRWPLITLATIKRDPLLTEWELVRLPRLSVMPVSLAQRQRLEALGTTK